jgi:glutamine amidotransferase
MTAAATSAQRKAVVIDAGVGNLGNLERALRTLGASVERTEDPSVVAGARSILLPGVGAFRPPRERLRGALEEALGEALAAGAHLLGICVGFQLLFDGSEEFGTTDGLGLLGGKIEKLPETSSLPHIGWNRLVFAEKSVDGRSQLLTGIEDGAYAYFVHSFAPSGVAAAHTLATCTHGRSFPAIVRCERVYGTQFHPEKSGAVGLRLLDNFLEISHAAATGD